MMEDEYRDKKGRFIKKVPEELLAKTHSHPNSIKTMFQKEHEVKPEWKENARTANLGIRRSPKTEFQKGNILWSHGDSREHGWTKGKKMPNLSISLKKSYAEGRKRMRYWLGKKRPDTSERNTIMNRQMHQYDTAPEKEMEKWLIENNITFEKQTPLEKITTADFFVPPNTIIYVDGDYWHSFPERQKVDEKITRSLSGMGFHVYRLKESELNEGIRPTILKKTENEEEKEVEVE
jgi:very-short-patch-repair endonuclease